MPMIFVGLPVLANERFVEGAYVYRLEMASYDGGAFLGAVMAGKIAGPSDKKYDSYNVLFIYLAQQASP